MNLTKVLRYFSMSPIKAHDEHTRTQERYRLALWSSATNILNKGTGMLVMLVAIKLSLIYLSADRFGAWLTIASFAAMLSFLDLGAGNALTNHIATTAAHDDKIKLRENISGGVGVLFIIGLAISILLVFIASIIPWQNIIKVNSIELYEEIRNSCMLFGGLFGIQLFSNGLQKIFSGLQKSYIANLISTASNIITVIALYFATSHQAGIFALLLVTLGCGAILNCTLLIFLINKNLFALHLTSKATKKLYKPLLNSGGLFFVLQIATMVGWGADSLIISSTLGAAQVAIFGITQKLFQFVSQPLSIINTPLWSAYADAYARKDINFIKKTLKLSLSFTAIVAIAMGLLISIWSKELCSYWTNDQVITTTPLIIAFFIWTICETLGSAFSMFLNGCGIIKPQAYATVALMLLSVPTKILLVTNYGASSMVFGFTVVYLLVNSIFLVMLYKTKNKHL